jgi:hypothetical protein
VSILRIKVYSIVEGTAGRQVIREVDYDLYKDSKPDVGFMEPCDCARCRPRARIVRAPDHVSTWGKSSG